jgi:hypothetical protein
LTWRPLPRNSTRLIDVNVRNSVAVLRAAWPVLRANGYGRIVNTCSGSILACHGRSATSVVGLIRSLAQDGAAQHHRQCGVTNRMDDGDLLHPDERFRAFLNEYFPAEDCAQFGALPASAQAPCSGGLFSVGSSIATRAVLGVTLGHVTYGPPTSGTPHA